MQRDLAHLLDILQSARKIQDFLRGVDEAHFMQDSMRQDAVVRRIEIIGEATRRISQEFRTTHLDVAWQQMAGMRNRLIHEYDRVDLIEGWVVAQQDIPALIARSAPLVPPESPDGDA
jgi:uncharacterized protein with HEPN domain